MQILAFKVRLYITVFKVKRDEKVISNCHYSISTVSVNLSINNTEN